MHVVALLALELIQLTGPDHQVIQINPNEIVSIRTLRGSDHFGPGVRCIISTSDGKFIGVTESCESVHDMLEGGQE